MDIIAVPFSQLGESEHATWREILAAQSFPNPLDHPDYLQCLALAGREIGVLKGTENGRDVLFWPFERKTNPKALQPVALPASDCSQFVAAKGVTFDAGDLLRQSGFASYDFDHLFDQTAFEVMDYAYQVSPCYLICLEQGFQAYLQDLSKKSSKLAAQTRRKKNKLEREIGAVRFVDASSDESHLQLLLDWKIRQLDSQGFAHCFREQWAIRFMKTHIEKRSEFCQGKLSLLMAGDQIAAMHYGSFGYGTINSWLPAINPELANYSPALILYLELVRFASENGYRTIILGQGENQTKTRLSNAQVNNYVGTINSGILGKARNWGMKGLYRLAQGKWGKYLREKTRRTRK